MPHRGHSDADQAQHGGEAEIREAYDRGRRGADRRRRPSLVLTAVKYFLCGVGALTLMLSFYKGSFTEGGMIIDRNIAVARGQGIVHRVDDRSPPRVRDGSQTETAAVDGNWIANGR